MPSAAARMPRRIVLTCAAAIALGAPCAARAAHAQAGWPPRLVYRTPAFDSVQVRRGIEYAPPADSVTRRLDLFAPLGARPGERAPVAIFVHGALVRGRTPPATTWPLFDGWGRGAAARGVAAVTFDHRLTTSGNHADGAEDLAALLDFLRARQEELALDLSRLCLVVFSAGGPLAAPAVAGERAGVRCVALYYAQLDAAGASVVDALARRGGSAPYLLVARGARDEVPGINASIERFVAEARARGVAFAFHDHPTAGHGFDAASDDATSRAIIAATLDFIAGRLAAPPSPRPAREGGAGSRPSAR